MEKKIIDQEIGVICLLVPTFPAGIKEAFDELINRYGMAGRRCYGISYMDENFQVVYKAGISGTAEEAKDLELFTIQKGTYLTETIQDWMSNIESIKFSFTRLMNEDGFDDTYPCIEDYISDDEVVTMVREKNK